MSPNDHIHSCSYFCKRPACIEAQRDALRDANLRLSAERDQAIARIRDMLMGDDGQAWKEARKFLDRIDGAPTT